MVLPASGVYYPTVTSAHKQATNVRVFHGGVEVTPEGGVPVIDGSVSMASSNRVTRSLQLQVPFEYFPHNPDDLLSPFQAVVRVEAGIEYLDGRQEVFPVFTGRIYTATLDGDGAVTMRADDLAADVLAYQFEQPFSIGPGYSVINTIEALIADAVPGASFGPHTAVDALIPDTLSWDDDRGKALDDLASVVGARWFTTGDGSFVVRTLPYAAGSGGADLNLYDGPDSQALLINADKTVTRDATANSITVISERLDNTPPITATWRDTGGDSPTQFGGNFGKVSQVLKTKTPVGFAEAVYLAQQQLAASLALTEQWSLTVSPFHTIEPDDRLSISYRGVRADQIADNITLPLTTEGAMTIRTRAAEQEPSGDIE